MMEIKRTIISGTVKLEEGKNKIAINLKTAKHNQYPHLKSGIVDISVNGKKYASGNVPILINLGFTANDCMDVGTDLGSPVSESYFNKAPFNFN